MENTHRDQHAFPTPEYSKWGLTKREYFAAMAMQGFLSNARLIANKEETAAAAVKMADHLIAALNAEKGGDYEA